MARKPRKRKVKEILRIENLPIEQIESVVNHLSERFPTSGQLVTYRNELIRRSNNGTVETADE